MQVEPFARALSQLRADVMINGRRRDHGAERAQLEVPPAPSHKISLCSPYAL